MLPRQVPSPWTGDCISLLRPQKHPHPWTKVTSRHRASTPGTLSVDKCYLQAPCIHARHPLRGQAVAFLFCVHTRHPFRGQKSPTGTVHPHQAPHPWTNATSRHPLRGPAATILLFRPRLSMHLWRNWRNWENWGNWGNWGDQFHCAQHRVFKFQSMGMEHQSL